MRTDRHDQTRRDRDVPKRKVKVSRKAVAVWAQAQRQLLRRGGRR